MFFNVHFEIANFLPLKNTNVFDFIFILKGDSTKFGIHPMEDARYFYVYENQRWNPLTGFTSHGLPTDRFINNCFYAN